MVALTIALALIADLVLLSPLLIAIDRKNSIVVSDGHSGSNDLVNRQDRCPLASLLEGVQTMRPSGKVVMTAAELRKQQTIVASFQIR